MTPKISVIIPVYNVAPYLEKCLDSVLCQTLEPIELVCVDDGSTDACPEILARYAAAHENLRVVTQANGGLSRARNAALDHAAGEYVFMLDSDDFLLHADDLERLWEIAHRDRLDILRLCGDGVYDAEGTSPEFRREHAQMADPIRLKGNYPGVCDGQELCAQLRRNGDYSASACFALYRREFLEAHALRFLPGIIHEDEVFTPICYAFAERAACTDVRCYGRFVRPDSIMTSARKTPSVRSYCLGADHLAAFRRDHPELREEFRSVLDNRIYNMDLLAAKFYLDLPRAERRACIRGWDPQERDRILGQLTPMVRQEGARRFRVAVKGHVPRPLWQLAKRMKR